LIFSGPRLIVAFSVYILVKIYAEKAMKRLAFLFANDGEE